MDAALFVPTEDELIQTRHEIREFSRRYPVFFEDEYYVRFDLVAVASIIKASRILGLTDSQEEQIKRHYYPLMALSEIIELPISDVELQIGIGIATHEIIVIEPGEFEYVISQRNAHIIKAERDLHRVSSYARDLCSSYTITRGMGAPTKLTFYSDIIHGSDEDFI